MKKLLTILVFLAAGPLDITGSLSSVVLAQTHTIKGNVGAATVVLSWTDTTAKTLTVAGTGDYTIVVSPSWSGTVTPSKTGFAFTPVSRTYANVTQNQNNQNFTQTAITYLISGNAGTSAATLAYTDGTAKTATSNSGGDYSFTVSYNWSGTVTPSKTGYIFTPPNRAYANVLADQPGQDYAAVRFFTIAGDAGGSGITINWTDTTAKTAAAASDGKYTIVVSDGWSGTITPTKTGSAFSPTNRTYTNVTANATSQNFTETPITFAISGNTGVGTVTLSWNDGGPKTATSAANGTYSIAVSYNWSGTVTPSKTGYLFTPPNRAYANVLADQSGQDYAAVRFFTIAGDAGGSGITINWTDTTAKTAAAASDGKYTIVVSDGWSGTVTPTKTGSTFSPTNRTYTNVTANVINQNFTETPITFAISGNTGVGTVTLSWNDGGPKTVTSAANGTYSIAVSYNWSGTVTPSKIGYLFTPPNYTYANVLADQPGQDFTAQPARFTISGNAGIAGAILSWTDTTAKSTTADETGLYSITVSYSFDGDVTPTLTGYIFTPTKITYHNVVSDQPNRDYTAARQTFTISGQAGRSGVVLSWIDTTAKSVTASGRHGDYTIIVSYGWSGIVTPNLTGYVFTPQRTSYTNVVTNQTNEDYNDVAGWTIAGNAGVGGAILSWTDGYAKTAQADGAGAYIITVVKGWTGTVTPSSPGYTFVPVNIPYTNLGANQTGKDYVATPFVVADLKVLLSGPFHAGVMNTGLNAAHVIPVNSNDAYAMGTYGYTGKIVATIPSAAIVDWVLIELRSGTAASTKVATEAAFLKNDGTVVDSDGSSALLFPALAHGSYYIVVRHRNHLAVMSAAPVAFNGTSTPYDFTTAQSQAYGTNALFALGGGVFGMAAGDVNRDGYVRFTSASSDRLALLNVIGLADPTISVNGYLDADLNLDGAASFIGPASDRLIMLATLGLIDPTVPVITQVPN